MVASGFVRVRETWFVVFEVIEVLVPRLIFKEGEKPITVFKVTNNVLLVQDPGLKGVDVVSSVQDIARDSSKEKEIQETFVGII